MNKKILFGGITVIIFTLIITLFFINSDTYKDKKVWTKLQFELSEDNISQIEINGFKNGNVILINEEKQQFIKWLRSAEFQESNRIAHGPTPYLIITVTFNNQTQVSFTTVQGYILETSPMHLDLGSQFFVKSNNIGEYFEAKKGELLQ